MRPNDSKLTAPFAAFAADARAMCCAIVLLAAAVTANAHSDLVTAIATINDRIVAQPQNAELRLRRGELHRRHEDWDAALIDYDAAGKRGYDPHALLYYKGRMFFEAGRYEHALECLDALLDAQPDHTNARIVRARIPMQPPASAVADLEHALGRMNAPTPELYLLRARLLLLTGPAGFDSSMDSLTDAIEQLGPLVSLISFAVKTCETQRDYPRALAFIALLPSRVRDGANWRARRGDLWQLAGHGDRARKEYAAALHAIESLPAARRTTRAVQRLEKSLRSKLGVAGTDNYPPRLETIDASPPKNPPDWRAHKSA